MGAERLRKCLIFGAALILSACGIASAPLQTERKVVPKPIDGQLSVVTQSEKPVGNLIPVYVAIANGTDEGRTVHPSQVFALNEYDERIAPVPPLEAARRAGGAQKLKAAVESGVVGGAAEGTVGGKAPGAGVGPGAPVGGAAGASKGAPLGQAEAQNQANAQIQGLALSDTEIRKDFTVSGYIFFPKGSYTDLEMLVVNNETGATETVKVPWH